MADRRKSDVFALEVPLDASEVEDFKPEQNVRVVVRAPDGTSNAETVRLDAKGKGSASFRFRENPGALRVVLGPEAASEDELLQAQTITVDISPRQWELGKILKLPPLRIAPFYWYWWLRWCRTFTIRGRVVCPDGRPVPGAKVCASDVDLWWWWSSVQDVGCAVTDANGAFEIKFRWCCGFWPWWWWRHRHWRLEPWLADRIVPVLQQELQLPKPPVPSAKPELGIFDELLAEEGFRTRQALAEIDQSSLERLRLRLVERIPVAPELARLRIWPWWPWHPWWDCTPDIIFRVTQDCGAQEAVIVSEEVSDTRWNVPTTLDVTLVANDEACCVEPQDVPVGVCMVFTHACDDPVHIIGGNPTAPPAPAGYRSPGKNAVHGDRPFAGVIPIWGLFGDQADVDYYEFEWSDDGGGNWHSMPAAAAGGFGRRFWGPALPSVPGGPPGPLSFHVVPFHFTDISGRRVVESREHFEATNDPGSWGMWRFWTGGRNMLMRWITRNPNQSVNFPDGTFSLRVRGWDLSGDALVNPRVLPLCNTSQDNGIALTIDNRLVGAGSGHPSAPDHPCGSGTDHICTTEPDTDFLDVRINGASIGPCAIVDATTGGSLEIDFMAHDPDGHLAFYTLRALYKENLAINLLGVSGALLIPGPGGPSVPPAAQVGPHYGDADPAKSALAQGAISPLWHGGGIRYVLSDLRQAFPESCSYQLELRAYKRTIDNCDDYWPHRNRSRLAFAITV